MLERHLAAEEIRSHMRIFLRIEIGDEGDIDVFRGWIPFGHECRIETNALVAAQFANQAQKLAFAAADLDDLLDSAARISRSAIGQPLV